MTINERIASTMDIKYNDYDEGNIGLISNSAGLCMATSDKIVHEGGKPANFADLGGSAIHEQIDTLFNIMESNERVKVVFINCYGGLMSIKKVIATLLNSLKYNNLNKPIVIRCLGRDAEDVNDMLAGHFGKHPIIVETDFDKACKLAV